VTANSDYLLKVTYLCQMTTDWRLVWGVWKVSMQTAWEGRREEEMTKNTIKFLISAKWPRIDFMFEVYDRSWIGLRYTSTSHFSHLMGAHVEHRKIQKIQKNHIFAKWPLIDVPFEAFDRSRRGLRATRTSHVTPTPSTPSVNNILWQTSAFDQATGQYSVNFTGTARIYVPHFHSVNCMYIENAC